MPTTLPTIPLYVQSLPHQLPTIDFGATPLHPPDMDFERQDIIGRRFDAVRTAPVKLKNGKLGVELQLLLAPRNFKENGVEVSLAVAVALEMRHPENCPRRPGK